MDSPISSHSSSSSSTLTMSPQVFSPCPIKACYSKKNNLDSVRFFDLMEDLGQLSLNRASSYPVEKLCKTSIEDTDDNEFERSALRRSFGELERKSITSHFYMNEVDSEVMMTAPIRASNPQIYDQRFAQMDQMDQQIGFSAREKNTYTKIQKVLNWV